MRHDLRYALRFLRNRPVFALIAAGTLAFAIGGNTVVFTIVDAAARRAPLSGFSPAGYRRAP